MHQAALLTSIVALHLTLTILPGIAVILVAARAGVRDAVTLLAVGMVGISLPAILGFWAYFAAPVAGKACSIVFVAVSLLVSFRYRRSLGADRQLLRQLSMPVALWCLASGFLVFLGFMQGGTDQPLALAMKRFSHPLPGDNFLPLFFADALFTQGHAGPPAHAGDWLSSDRPPLQSGFVLAQRIFEWSDSSLHYQVLGVILQQFWIVGLWALLTAMRVRIVTAGLIIFTIVLSDVAIVNGFFVWPKLLSTAFLLAAAAFILSERWREARHDPRLAVLVSALFGLSLFSHGGSIFGIISLAIIAGARGLPTLRWVGAGLATGVLLLVPWMLYQRYEDPPANRLTKWLLAGVAEIDGRTTLEALRDSYATAGINGALQNKIGNFWTMAGGREARSHMVTVVESGASGNFRQAIGQVRADRFFHFLPSLGIFAVAPLVMLLMRTGARRNSEDWAFALSCFTCAIIGCAGWGLIIFGHPGPLTIMHAGSYLLPILALAGCVAGVCAVSLQLAICMVVLHAVVALALYVPVLDPFPGARFSWVSATVAMLMLACVGILSFRSSEASHVAPEFTARAARAARDWV